MRRPIASRHYRRRPVRGCTSRRVRGAWHDAHGARQYVDYKDATIHTNTVEGAFSIFKRGMTGVYQHCGEQHLHRYLAEFEFRYNHRIANGVDYRGRAIAAVKGIVGKRITYEYA